MSKKYIFVTGGVISGIGKGVTTASTGFFFCEKHKVCTIKLDGYLNIDPGTMNPVEHGEVFVLADGGEVDMDFGHYERFLGINCSKTQSISMGKIYSRILEQERNGKFLGQTVQMIPHVTNSIIETIEAECEAQKAEICLIEVGGTVGDIEVELYLEAIRQMKQQKSKHDVLHLHLTYVPVPGGVNEQKTKPTQQSINLLQSKGLFPDMIIARSSNPLELSARKKIALFSNLSPEHIFSTPDVDCIYKIPEILKNQGFLGKIEEKLDLQIPEVQKLTVWNNLLATPKNHTIIVGIIGKYTSLEDSYSSVVSALEHCSFHLQSKIEIRFISTRDTGYKSEIIDCDACIIPGGFGTSGMEHLIEAVSYLREQEIPTLGICLGMQIMVIEFLRNVAQITQANSLEFDNSAAPYDVITLLETQKDTKELGGTMRLGEQETQLEAGKILELYTEQKRVSAQNSIFERFRHRYEVNKDYVQTLEENGMQMVGFSKNEHIVQFIELPDWKHPFFIGTQSHPELTSTLEKPAPLFLGLIQAALKNSKN